MAARDSNLHRNRKSSTRLSSSGEITKCKKGFALPIRSKYNRYYQYNVNHSLLETMVDNVTPRIAPMSPARFSKNSRYAVSRAD